MADIVPEALDDLKGQQRTQLYRKLPLEVIPSPEGYEAKGAFCTSTFKETEGNDLQLYEPPAS